MPEIQTPLKSQASGSNGEYTAVFPNGFAKFTPTNCGDLDLSSSADHWLRTIVDLDALDQNHEYDVEIGVRCKVTYSYVDPDGTCDGDFDDHGYILGSYNRPCATTEYNLSLPRCLARYTEYSAVLNDLESLSPQDIIIKFDESNIDELCDSRYVSGPSGESMGSDDVIKFLIVGDQEPGWIELSSNTGEATLNLHPIKG